MAAFSKKFFVFSGSQRVARSSRKSMEKIIAEKLKRSDAEIRVGQPDHTDAFMAIAPSRLSYAIIFSLSLTFVLPPANIRFRHLVPRWAPSAEKAKNIRRSDSMKTLVPYFTEFRKYPLSEFELYDNVTFITFHFDDIGPDHNSIQPALTDGFKIIAVMHTPVTGKIERCFEYDIAERTDIYINHTRK